MESRENNLVIDVTKLLQLIIDKEDNCDCGKMSIARLNTLEKIGLERRKLIYDITDLALQFQECIIKNL